MAKSNSRYKQMELYMLCALLAAVIFFIIYLCSAGAGIIWLKVISAILSILICVLCLAFLYLSKELMRPRSLWMSVCALAVIVCLIFSLILKYPSPAPPAIPTETQTSESAK